MSMCPSVRPSVRLSVCPSVTPAVSGVRGAGEQQKTMYVFSIAYPREI